LYTDADIQRIRHIKDLKNLLGLSLSEIKRILDADEARTRFLAAAEEAAEPAGRTRAVESALEVTEGQLRSVRDKVQQLGQLQRQLERHVRELKKLLHDAGRNHGAERVGGRV
jgi:DNA-binding transcriptional MerR regulator